MAFSWWSEGTGLGPHAPQNLDVDSLLSPLCLWQMASPGSAKVGQAELTQKVEELQKKLDEEVKVRRGSEVQEG